jgi:hypothetical protein
MHIVTPWGGGEGGLEGFFIACIRACALLTLHAYNVMHFLKEDLIEEQRLNY